MPGPSNLYGVANPGFGPTLINATADTVVAVGSWVTVATSGPVYASSAGYFTPYVVGGVMVTNGAAPTVGLAMGFSINNGSSVNNISWDYRFFLASAEQALTAALPGVASNTAWVAPGSSVQLQVQAFTNGVTIRQLGTWFTLMLFRAPDQ